MIPIDLLNIVVSYLPYNEVEIISEMFKYNFFFSELIISMNNLHAQFNKKKFEKINSLHVFERLESQFTCHKNWEKSLKKIELHKIIDDLFVPDFSWTNIEELVLNSKITKKTIEKLSECQKITKLSLIGYFYSETLENYFQNGKISSFNTQNLKYLEVFNYVLDCNNLWHAITDKISDDITFVHHDVNFGQQNLSLINKNFANKVLNYNYYGQTGWIDFFNNLRTLKCQIKHKIRLKIQDNFFSYNSFDCFCLQIENLVTCFDFLQSIEFNILMECKPFKINNVLLVSYVTQLEKKINKCKFKF